MLHVHSRHAGPPPVSLRANLPSPLFARITLVVLLAALPMLLLAASLCVGLPGAARAAETADGWYRQGFALQQEFNTLQALDAYKKALALDPFHARAHYEIGWSYWILEDWQEVVRHWELASQARLDQPDLPDYLAMARERLDGRHDPLVRPPIGTRSEPPAAVGAKAAPAEGSPGALSLELIARFQHYDPDAADPADRFDRHLFSPKSVRIAPDGGKAYVQALEGHATIVYDARTLTKLRAIIHAFGPEDAALFDAAETASVAETFRAEGAPVEFNRYEGKPVEGVFTHGGRYLWVSHYRRSFDELGILPSSVAIVDTQRDAIVRVMHTGPIPKFLAASSDGRWLAVVHWGDNTVGLIDIRGDDPAAFRHAGEIVVERRLSLELEGKVNRDRYCGLCLRGAVFTPDSRHLLVARMGGGGIAVLDVRARRLLGSVHGMRPTPRHLLLAPDGETLYVGSNSSGYVATYRIADLLAAARAGTLRLKPRREVRTGEGTRTIALSPDGTLLFAAIHRGSTLLALDAHTLRKLAAVQTDSFPVGLDVTPDGRHVWVTAQGYKLRGGNAVTVYEVKR